MIILSIQVKPIDPGVPEFEHSIKQTEITTLYTGCPNKHGNSVTNSILSL